MAISLKDQLLKAGLANKKQAKQVELEQRKQAKQKKTATDSDDIKLQAQAARQAKLERDRELNARQQEEQAQRARLAEARQLIEQHRIALPSSGDQYCHFGSSEQSKQLRVNAELARQILSGQVCLLWVDQQYLLLPSAVAERILERDPSAENLPVQDRRAQIAAEEAAYADYAIPDDLDW